MISAFFNSLTENTIVGLQKHAIASSSRCFLYLICHEAVAKRNTSNLFDVYFGLVRSHSMVQTRGNRLLIVSKGSIVRNKRLCNLVVCLHLWL